MRGTFCDSGAPIPGYDVSCMFFQANSRAIYSNTPIHPCTLEQYIVKQQMEKKIKKPWDSGEEIQYSDFICLGHFVL